MKCFCEPPNRNANYGKNTLTNLNQHLSIINSIYLIIKSKDQINRCHKQSRSRNRWMLQVSQRRRRKQLNGKSRHDPSIHMPMIEEVGVNTLKADSMVDCCTCSQNMDTFEALYAVPQCDRCALFRDKCNLKIVKFDYWKAFISTECFFYCTERLGLIGWLDADWLQCFRKSRLEMFYVV